MSHFIAFDLPESIEKSPDIFGAFVMFEILPGSLDSKNAVVRFLVKFNTFNKDVDALRPHALVDFFWEKHAFHFRPFQITCYC